jgi:hypothetical protein
VVRGQRAQWLSRAKSAIWPIALFAVVMTTHTHGNMGCADSRWSIFTAVSVLDQGNFDLDEYLQIVKDRGFYFTEQTGGHYYTVYPFGASLLAAPVVAILRPIARAVLRWRPNLRSALSQAQAERGCPPVNGEPVIRFHSWTELIVATVIVAAATAVIYGVARDQLSPPAAAFIALLFAFGTSAWSTASRSLWQHGPLMLMLALALLIQIRNWPLLFMGAALGFSYVVRPTATLPLLIGTIWVALQRPRRFLAYSAGVAIVLVPFFLNNQSIYSAWLPPYYRPSYYGSNRLFLDAFLGSLVSPGRGLLVYSPIFLFVPLGLLLRWRRGRLTLLDALLAAAVAIHMVGVAWVNAIWWGGYSYGPRFTSDVLPYMMYLLVPFVAWLIAARHERHGRIAAILFAIAAAWSVFVHAEGALSAAAVAWNVVPDDINQNQIRLWSWSHPPFLAAVQRPPELPNLNAIPCTAPPGAPTDLTVASNARHVVVLEWRPASTSATEFIIESGTAPGLRSFPDRSVLTGEPTVTFYPVQPGTYFGRVRARNPCGVSGVSNEVRVEVE